MMNYTLKTHCNVRAQKLAAPRRYIGRAREAAFVKGMTPRIAAAPRRRNRDRLDGNAHHGDAYVGCGDGRIRLGRRGEGPSAFQSRSVSASVVRGCRRPCDVSESQSRREETDEARFTSWLTNAQAS